MIVDKIGCLSYFFKVIAFTQLSQKSGSRGIGKAIAERLVNEGTKVYAIGKTRENLDKLKAEVPTVNLIQVNISDWDKTKTVLEQIGTVDLLVNNAAITGDGKFIDAEKE
ncbi:hypothetical protein KUTeg_021821 [Tegillarca granosa]|uniref:Uncharacterized protein n=1 Tax=Tegillarca granosa TaxID=220873 RepID=A0ABQ9E8V0_TEGGR|nr:hypothetical protein KUTeg_021821 [Tegillarca granosa]